MNSRMHHRSEGQSLVLIALLMIAMIAFLGLLIDGGSVMLHRRSTQNASDSAAFAGVRVLALRTDNSAATVNSVWNAVANIASANGITTTDVTATLIDQNGNDICQINQSVTPSCNSSYGGVPASPYPTGLRVTTTLHLQPYFISVVIGNAAIPTKSVAAAQSGSPTGFANLMPMALKVPTQTLQYGVSYTLQGVPQLAGGFQWASYDCGTSNADLVGYLDLLKAPVLVSADPSDTFYHGPPNQTDFNWPCPGNPPSPLPWVPSGPGVKPDASISNVLDCWLALSSGCWGTVSPPGTWGTKPLTDTWTIPVFNHDNGLTGSNAQYHIVEFAAFQFQGYWFANNQCNWIGKLPSQHCNKISDLPPALQGCADVQDPNAPPGDKQKCIMGAYLRAATPAQIQPGVCNDNALNACGFGLSQ